LKQPEPQVFFDNFGDSALNFELAVWTSEMLTSPRRFRSDLNFAIEKALRENGIHIPFPQRDLHLRSGALVVSTEHGETKVRVGDDGGPPTPTQE
jgi:small-conductance mechanosensitive channel